MSDTPKTPAPTPAAAGAAAPTPAPAAAPAPAAPAPTAGRTDRTHLIMLGIAALALIAVGATGGPPAPPRPANAPSPAPVASKPEVGEIQNFRLASALPSQLLDLGSGGPRFVRVINAVSGGTLRFAFTEPGAPVGARDVFDAVAKGRVESGWGIAAYWSDRMPASVFFSGVPFGPDANELLAWIRFGGGQAIYDGLYEPHGVKPIPCAVAGAEGSGWFRKEIAGPKDLKGLKMRFYGMGAKVVAKLGVVPVLPEGDVFAALESGAIDAVEYSMPAVDAKLEFDRIAKNYYFPGWHQPTTIVELLVSLGKWRGLSPQHRAQIEAACGDNIQFTMTESAALPAAALAEIRNRGVAIRRWPQPMLALFKKHSDDVLAEEAARDAAFRRTLDSLTTFRGGYATWRTFGSL